MRRFLINFRKSASDRAGELSLKAHNHYLKFRPIVDKIKFNLEKYGKSQERISFPRKTQKASKPS